MVRNSAFKGQIRHRSARVIQYSRSPDSALFGDAGTQLFTGNQEFVIHDGLEWTKGRHSLKFGGDYTRSLIRTEFVFNTAGQFEYLGVFTQNPFADFLLGFNSVANALTGDPLLHGIGYRVGAYVQDDWRVTSKLTVNLGLRYDLQPPYFERDNNLGNFTPLLPGGGFCYRGQSRPHQPQCGHRTVSRHPLRDIVRTRVSPLAEPSKL